MSKVLYMLFMLVIISAGIWLAKYTYDDCRTNTKLSIYSCIQLGD